MDDDLDFDDATADERAAALNNVAEEVGAIFYGCVDIAAAICAPQLMESKVAPVTCLTEAVLEVANALNRIASAIESAK